MTTALPFAIRTAAVAGLLLLASGAARAQSASTLGGTTVCLGANVTYINVPGHPASDAGTAAPCPVSMVNGSLYASCDGGKTLTALPAGCKVAMQDGSTYTVATASPPPPSSGAGSPPAAPQVCALEAGVVKTDADAVADCPKACPAPSTWTGAWRVTVSEGMPFGKAVIKMSTCDCATSGAPAGRICRLEAGPIWKEAEAAAKCGAVCKSPMKFNGAWRTSVVNKMSTCDCVNP